MSADGQTISSKLTGEVAVLNHKTTEGASVTWMIDDAADLGSFATAREDDAIRIEAKKLGPMLKDFSRKKFEAIKFGDIKHVLDEEQFDPSEFL